MHAVEAQGRLCERSFFCALSSRTRPCLGKLNVQLYRYSARSGGCRSKMFFIRVILGEVVPLNGTFHTNSSYKLRSSTATLYFAVSRKGAEN